jgi:hypothetical protein
VGSVTGQSLVGALCCVAVRTGCFLSGMSDNDCVCVT